MNKTFPNTVQVFLTACGLANRKNSQVADWKLKKFEIAVLFVIYFFFKYVIKEAYIIRLHQYHMIYYFLSEKSVLK